jgi:hypothetical protein
VYVVAKELERLALSWVYLCLARAVVLATPIAACSGSTFDDCRSVNECVGESPAGGGAGGSQGNVGESGSNGVSAGAGGCRFGDEACGGLGTGGEGGLAGGEGGSAGGEGRLVGGEGGLAGGEGGLAPGGQAGIGGDGSLGEDLFSLGWRYRRPVEVTNPLKDRTNYVVLVHATFPWDQIEADARDLRVTASDGVTPLAFYVEKATAADGVVSVHVSVKLDLVAVGSRLEMFLYTGNPAASSVADGYSVFAAYEGFEKYPIGAVPSATGYGDGTDTVLSWSATKGLALVPAPTWRGSRSLQIIGTEGLPESMNMTFASFASQQRGTVAVWVRRGTNQEGTTDDLDLWIYGDGGEETARKAGVGLGGDGTFHCWGERPSPRLISLGEQWSTNSWYLLSLSFNVVTDAFVASVRDSEMNEVVNASNVLLGNAAVYVDKAALTTSSSYVDPSGTLVDEFRVRKFLSPEPTTVVGAAEHRP